jgi:hypothetical protein
MEISTLGGQATEQLGHVDKVFRNQMADGSLTLPSPIHRKQSR